MDNPVSIKQDTLATRLPLMDIIEHGYKKLLQLRHSYIVKRNVLLLIILVG